AVLGVGAGAAPDSSRLCAELPTPLRGVGFAVGPGVLPGVGDGDLGPLLSGLLLGDGLGLGLGGGVLFSGVGAGSGSFSLGSRSKPEERSTASVSWGFSLSTPVSMTATLTPLPLVSCQSWSRITRWIDHGVPLIGLAG
ncbi:hypothetical protein VR41_13605, partial [Streptomyces sp. NRRL B-1568]